LWSRAASHPSTAVGGGWGAACLWIHSVPPMHSRSYLLLPPLAAGGAAGCVCVWVWGGGKRQESAYRLNGHLEAACLLLLPSTYYLATSYELRAAAAAAAAALLLLADTCHSCQCTVHSTPDASSCCSLLTDHAHALMPMPRPCYVCDARAGSTCTQDPPTSHTHTHHTHWNASPSHKYSLHSSPKRATKSTHEPTRVIAPIKKPVRFASG
jgi:hypothetical protein